MKKSTWVFFLILIMSTMITMSATSWLGMWMGLELNMMAFIPLILNSSNKSSSEAAMIYFLTQSMSSMILLLMVLIYLNNMIMISIYHTNMLITISLLIKLGAAPFHNWMPEMLSKMEWNKCMILMTWQKIAPLFMMSNLMENSLIINISIIWSVGIGSLGGINQSSLRKMMGYSSINHLGWLLAIIKTMNLWLIYMTIYSMLVITVCTTFNNYKMYFINQISSFNMNNKEKLSLFIMMLSMGGLPPFIGFLPKWIVIQSMMYHNEIMITFIMIMCSLITLMYYSRIMTNMFLSFNSSMKWSIYYYNYNLTFIIMMMNLSLPLIMVMNSY